MIARRTACRAVLLFALVLVACAPGTATAQDALSRAKGLYESADYEQALEVLGTLTGPSVSTEAAAYQVFCLVALGRTDQARLAIEAIVRMDPLFRPSDAQVSPRIRTFFEDVRKPLLPEVVRQSYTGAKAAFDRKEWTSALREFNRVIALIDEIGDADPAAADLRTLASGFRDLARVALEPPVTKPAPPPAAPEPPLLKPAEPPVFGANDRDVKAPVVIKRALPEWRPANSSEASGAFRGAIELVIDEQGRVLLASLLQSVHPRYDAALLEAAKQWTFRPATLGGVPVRYRYAIAIKLGGG